MPDGTAEEPGIRAGVLLRAIEPLEEINLMKQLRKTDKVIDLARGPGRLAAGLQIDPAVGRSSLVCQRSALA